jgi:transposase
MWYVGLDVHLRFSVVHILDENGKVVKVLQVKGHWLEVMAVLKGLNHPFVICYEASCGYGYLYDQLVRIAKGVVVAHPGQLRLIFRSKKKNDRVDAKKLATLLFLGQVPQVHVPSVSVRSWRGLIEFRQRLIAKRTRVKNGLRSLMRANGVVLRSGTRLWTRKGMAVLRGAELPTGACILQRDLLLEELEHLETQAKRVTGELNAIGRHHAGVWLLQTIPGVGPRTAEAVVAYIDEARRFSRNKCIGSYFGLVPCQDASGPINRLGHITREGPAVVRKLLIEASWQGIRRSPEIGAYFERIQRGDPDRKKIALVATAHHLVRVMLSMLKTGEEWRYDAQTKPEAA